MTSALQLEWRCPKDCLLSRHWSLAGKPVSQGRCFWAMNNVKSLLNMLCAVDLRRIFPPRAKTILLVKQRHFHLFTD